MNPTTHLDLRELRTMILRVDSEDADACDLQKEIA
jgi:hypothetical protein